MTKKNIALVVMFAPNSEKIPVPDLVGLNFYNEVMNQSEYAEYCITSTGVLIVRNIDSNSIITAYCPNMNKAVAIFRKNGWADVPYSLKEKIDKNYKVAKKMGFI